MNTFDIINPSANSQIASNFEAIIAIVAGCTIKSFAQGEDWIELGLSEDFNLRITAKESGTGLEVDIVSTLNKAEVPSLRIRIIADGEDATLERVESRLEAIRELYATSILLSEGRIDEYPVSEQSDLAGYLESLLRPEQILTLKAASGGSFWITIAAKTISSYKTTVNVFAMFYPEGRKALLRRVRATTDLRELEVEEKRLSLDQQRAKVIIGMLKQIDTIKDEQLREEVKSRTMTNLLSIPGAGNSSNLVLLGDQESNPSTNLDRQGPGSGKI